MIALFSIWRKLEEGHTNLYHMVDDAYSKINRAEPKAPSSEQPNDELALRSFCQLVAQKNTPLTDVYPSFLHPCLDAVVSAEIESADERNTRQALRTIAFTPKR